MNIAWIATDPKTPADVRLRSLSPAARTLARMIADVEREWLRVELDDGRTRGLESRSVPLALALDVLMAALSTTLRYRWADAPTEMRSQRGFGPDVDAIVRGYAEQVEAAMRKGCSREYPCGRCKARACVEVAKMRVFWVPA